ncbi:putative malic acid transport protein [Aspergillus ambiguus]|uniref:putative malic acid transport protein n=1 Tax=Aspergillus ambiguus TaxID=176160 RepID=UPI003CCD6B1D
MPIQDDPPPAHPFSRAVWHFTPQWFLIPQGTGIIAVLLHQLHYQFGALPILAKIVWIYTIAVLGIFLAIYSLRICLYRHHMARELRDNILETSCLASIPITFTSIIQMASLQYGTSSGLAVYILWWITTGLSVTALIAIPYVQLKLQPIGLERIPPAILLPVIAALTSAAGAGVVCVSANISVRLQVPAILVAYLEIGAGFALAIAFSAVVLLDHFSHFHPTPEKVYQDMILCGPFGQGGFALQALGQAVLQGAFAAYDRGDLLTARATDPIGYISQFSGLLSWGFATFWWCFAIVSILHTLAVQPGGLRATRFTLATWSLIFPWGVYTNSAVELGKLMDSPAFHVWSTALLLLLIALTIWVTLFTVKGIVTGKVLGLDQGWRQKYVDLYGDKQA